MTMPRGLAAALTVTDLVFLAYWISSGAALTGLIHVPPNMLYPDYDKRLVVAWNWSFLPLDVSFSATGLAAVLMARRGSLLWRPLALISLVITMAAGLMAVSYWTLLCEFDPAWYLANAVLVVWPLFFLPSLLCALAGPPGPGETHPQYRNPA